MNCKLSTVVGVCVVGCLILAFWLGNGMPCSQALAREKESPSQAKRSGAMKYHAVLQKRPRPGYLFDRFYNTWLDESTVEELQQFLESRAKTSKSTADRLLVAFFHAKQGDDVAAIEQFRLALATDPGSAATLYNKALVEARTLDFETAIGDLKKAKQQKPDAKLAVLIDKQLGKLLLRNRQAAEAIVVWKALLAAHPGDEELCEDVIELHIDEGLFKEAAEMSTALIARTKDPYVDVTRRLRLGDIYHRSDRRDKAIEVYTSALDKVGHGSWLEREILAQIEQIFRREDDLAGLKKEYDALLKTHSKRIGIHRRMAKLLVELGKNDDAIKIYQNILKLTPGERAVREQYVATLAKIGRHEDAIKELKALCSQHAKDAELQIQLAKVMHEAKHAPDAVGAIREYLKIADQIEYSYLRAARLLEQFDDKAAAAEAYKQLAEKFADSPSAHEARAAFLYKDGKKDEALAIWTKLAKDADVNQTLHVARALAARGEFAKAFGLLATREKDFAEDPLFLGQLAAAAFALKKYEEAIPWTRRRVELAKTTTELETAITQAAVACERSDKLDEAVLSLGAAKRSVQNACLLAELLERAGRSAEADKVLAEASKSNALLAVGQQIRLFGQRYQWAEAAKATRRMLELPGGRKSLHVRKLVELYERDFKIAEALKWVEQWKRVSPGNTAPWFTEARLLKLQGKEDEALNALRNAIQRFDGNADLRAMLAQMYAGAGKAADAERIYWQLYEEAADVGAKVRWAQQLGDLAESQGKVERLVENFKERCRNNRRSIVPLLSLAEIHRATDNYEGRRRALTDAAKIKPDDLYLILNIARIEEQDGDWRGALATLERALPLDKTTKTRKRMAHLHLQYGSTDEGFAILFELAGEDKADPRIIETIADTMCGMQEWERAAEFLGQRISEHPDDYRLHYLLAVAYEESGQTESALREFARLLDGQQELAKTANKPQTNSSSSYFGMIKGLLPPTAAEWLEQTRYTHTAYMHRQQRGARYTAYSTSASASIRSSIQLPNIVEQVRPYALAHLLMLANETDEEKAGEMAALLSSHGIRDAEILMEMGVERGSNSPKLIETLEKYPDNETALAIYAIYGMQRQQVGSSEIAIRAFDKFRKSRPQLAIMAGLQVASDEVKGKKILDDALAIAATIKNPNPLMMVSLARPLGGMRGQQQNVSLGDEHRRKLSKLLIDWYPQMQNSPMGSSAFIYVAMALRGSADPGLYFTFLDGEVARWRGGGKNSAGANSLAARMGRQQNQQSIAPLAFPPQSLSDFPANIIMVLQRGNNNPYAQMMPTTDTWSDEKVKAALKKVKDPMLRVLLAQYHEDEKLVGQTLAELLAAKPPTLDAYLLAAAKASDGFCHAEAVEMLEKARYLPMPRAMRRQVDSAMVAAVLAAKDAAKPKGKSPDKSFDKMIEAGKSAALRLRRARLTIEQRNELIAAMQDLGMKKEAEKLDKMAAPAAASRSPRGMMIPAPARNTPKDRIARLMEGGNRDAAVRLLVNEVKSNVQQLLANPGNAQYMQYQFRELKKRIESYGLLDDVLKKLASTDQASSRRMRDYGIACEFFGRTQEARNTYEKILAKRDKDNAVRTRLVLLLADKELSGSKLAESEQFSKFDEHLMKLAADPSQPFGESLTAMLQDYQISHARRIRAARLGVRFLRLAKENKKAQLQWANNFVQLYGRQMYSNVDRNQLPSLYARNTSEANMSKAERDLQKKRLAVHRELCLAMIEVPELGREGFKHLLASAEARGKVFLANASEADKKPEGKPDDEFAVFAQRIILAEIDNKNRRTGAMSGSVRHYGSNNAQVRSRNPEEYLVCRAFISGDWKPVETLLPKLEGRLGKPIKDRLASLTKLYKCPEGEFIATAKAIDKQYSQSTMPGMPPMNEGRAMAVDAWSGRKLSLDIQPLLLKWLRDGSSNMQYGMYGQFEFLTQYLSALADRGERGKTLAMLDETATVFLGPQDKREEFIKKHYNPRQVSSGSPNGRIHIYRQLMQSLSQDESILFVLLAHVDEFDTFNPVDNLEYRVRQAMQRGMKKDAESMMKMLEQTPWLRDLEEFRVLRLGKMAGEWALVKTLEDIRRNKKLYKDIRDALAKREKAKPTFGGSLFLACLADDQDRKPVLEHLGKNLEAIKKLPAKRQGYLSTLYYELIPSSTLATADASKDAGKSKQALAVREWLRASQAGQSMKLIERIRKAKRIEDLGVDHAWNLGRFLSSNLVELAKSDPAVAVEAFSKAATLATAAAKQGQWPTNSHEDRTIKGTLLERAFGYEGKATPEELAIMLDIMLRNKGEDIEIARSTRYFMDRVLDKIIARANGKKTATEKMKHLYIELGRVLDGRPSSLLCVAFYNKLHGRFNAKSTAEAVEWAKSEMQGGKYPKLAADAHAVLRMMQTHKTNQSGGKRREMADYHEYFRKVVNDDKRPLTWRIYVAVFLVERDGASRMPVELARDLASLYIRCLEGNTPLAHDHNCKMMDLLVAIRDEPGTAELIDGWREQWAKRYLRPAVPTSRTTIRRAANTLTNAKAICRALQLYLGTGDIERVEKLCQKYRGNLDNTLIPTSLLIRAGQFDMAMREFRAYQNTGDFNWSSEHLARYDAEIRAKKPAFLAKFTDDDERFLAEVTLAAMPDPPANSRSKKKNQASDKTKAAENIPTRDERLIALAPKVKGITFKKPKAKLAAVYMLSSNDKAAALLADDLAEHFAEANTALFAQSDNYRLKQQAGQWVARHIRNRLRAGDVQPLTKILDKQPAGRNNQHIWLEHYTRCIKACVDSLEAKDFKWTEEQYASLAASLRKAAAAAIGPHTSYHNSNDPFSRNTVATSHTLFMLAHAQGGQSKEFEKWLAGIPENYKGRLRELGLGKAIWDLGKKINGKPTAANLQERLQFVERAVHFALQTKLYRWQAGTCKGNTRNNSKASLEELAASGLLSAEEMDAHAMQLAEKLDDRGLVKAVLGQWLAEKKKYPQSIAALQAAIDAAPEKDEGQRDAWQLALADVFNRQGKPDQALDALKKVKPKYFLPGQKKTYDKLKSELDKLTAKAS